MSENIIALIAMEIKLFSPVLFYGSPDSLGENFWELSDQMFVMVEPGKKCEGYKSKLSRLDATRYTQTIVLNFSNFLAEFLEEGGNLPRLRHWMPACSTYLNTVMSNEHEEKVLYQRITLKE